MNYKKELTKFIEQKITAIESEISKLNYKMNHINSEYPRDELIAEIKKSTHSLNGVFINLFGDNYLKKQFVKVKRDRIRGELVKKKEIEDEYFKLLECVEQDLSIRKNEPTIDLIIEFAESRGLKYDGFVNLLQELGVAKVEIDGVLAIAINSEKSPTVYVQSLINTHKLNNPAFDKESLLKEKAKIQALSSHFSNGVVTNPTKNIEELKELLQGISLPEQAKERMIESMQEALDKKQDAENAELARRIIETFYSENSKEMFYKAHKIVTENISNPLFNLIKKSYKNILSLCKYLSILPEGNTEWMNSLNMIDSEILNLGNILIISEEQNLKKKMRFNYLLKSDESLQIKDDIDLLDITMYGLIESELSQLQNGVPENPKEVVINGIRVYITNGPIKIAYIEMNGIKMIITISNSAINELLKSRLSSKNFVSNLYLQIRKLIDNPEEETKARLYHEVIMRNLDIYNPPRHKLY